MTPFPFVASCLSVRSKAGIPLRSIPAYGPVVDAESIVAVGRGDGVFCCGADSVGEIPGVAGASCASGVGNAGATPAWIHGVGGGFAEAVSLAGAVAYSVVADVDDRAEAVGGFCAKGRLG